MTDHLSKRQLKRLAKEQAAVVKQDPNNLVARLKLAGALKDLGRHKEAVEHYRAVAKSYSEAGKIVQAISVYKGILEIAPDHAETEAALTALSAQRAEEIKRKSMPRLQQVEGRWIMPAEEEVSEEEGTDPGKAPPPPDKAATPSVLRLPATPSVPPGGGQRRTRRSRSRISRPALAGPSAGASATPPPVDSPPPLPQGWTESAPEAQLPPQPSLPSLGDSPAGPAPLPPPDEEASPSARPATGGDSPEVGHGPAEEPKASDAPPEGEGPLAAEVHMTAEAPDEAPRSETFEEPTSPGPDGYDSTIRQSMPRIDLAALAAQTASTDSGPKRSTLVGVPLPDHPSFTPRDLVDPEAHVRPTPSMPLPAIRRTRRAAGSEDPAEDTTAPGAPQAPPRDVGSGDAQASDQAADAIGTRAIRRTPPAPEESPPSRDQTLDDVFGDDEDAAWEELADLVPQHSQEPGGQGASQRTSPPGTPRPTLPLQATGARPPGDVPGEVGGAARGARSTLLMTPVTPSATPSPASPAPHPSGEAVAPPPKRPRDEEEHPAQPVPLESVPLFRDLSERSRDLLRSRVVVRREAAGARIVSEGEPGNAFFVVSEGEVEVTKRAKSGSVTLATLGPGTFFGEFALLSDRRRHATVTVVRDAVLFEVSRKVISDLTKAEPAFGATLRSFYRRRLLSTLVHSAPFFEPLSREEQESLMGKLRFRRIPKGKRIVAEGEAGGGFFLVLVGRVRVSTHGKDGKERVLARLGDGAYFGEMSLLKGGKAVASVVSELPTELVQLQAEEFYRILSQYPQVWEEVNREANRRSLANHKILAGKAPHGLATDESVVM